MTLMKSLGIEQWESSRKIDLALELWDSLDGEEIPPISDEVHQLLLKRSAEMDLNPPEVLTWEEIERRVLAE
jgi:putative addiction module component (TIGR02574 family)